MRNVVCRRCKAVVPKHSSRQNKVFGGRICPACDEYMFELATRKTDIAPPTAAPPLTQAPKKLGLINKIVNRLFRRRGVL